MEGACEISNPSPNFPPYFPTTTISPVLGLDSKTNFVITDIFVVLDTTWPYALIVDYVNFILQRLNINPHASAVTLLCAYNGGIIVNRTHYMTTLYEQWNTTTHSSFPQGFRMPNVLNAVRETMEGLLKLQVETASIGGQSVVALLLPSPVAFIPEWDYIYSRTFLEKLNATLPDINYLYFSGGAVVRWKEFVSNPHDDLFPLDPYQYVNQSAMPVVKRILKISRSVFNPGCYYTPVSINLEMLEVMPIAGFTFYRILPVYFNSNSGSSYLYIQSNNGIFLTVCTSRKIMEFTQRPTVQQGCHQVTPTTPFYLDMGALCYNNLDLTDCEPLYLAVFAPTFADPSQVICLDPSCQLPYMVQYDIKIVNTACNNAFQTYSKAMSYSLLILHFVLVFFFNHSRFFKKSQFHGIKIE